MSHSPKVSRSKDRISIAKKIFHWEDVVSVMHCFASFQVEHQYVKVNKNVYTEFTEFSRKEIKEYERRFKE